MKEDRLEFESVNLHTFPSDKFSRFCINLMGDRLASVDVNGAVRMFEIEKNHLKPLAGFGLAESLIKSRKSSVGKDKAHISDTRNPFDNNLQPFEQNMKDSPQLISSPIAKSKKHVSLDHSATAVFDSVRTCAFIADYTLLMVDDQDQIKVYDFKKR